MILIMKIILIHKMARGVLAGKVGEKLELALRVSKSELSREQVEFRYERRACSPSRWGKAGCV